VEIPVFMYFPTNYVWSMAAVAALNNGGFIDEVDRACKPVLEASQNGDDVGTELLYASWAAVADRLIASADDDIARNRLIGAGDKLYRASLYTSQAERLQAPGWDGRKAAYQKSIDLLLRHIELSESPVTTVEVPYEDTSLPGYFHPADPATLMVDTPGSGEALRMRGLTSRYDTEVWAAACIDFLEARGDVDAGAIGITGWSLGGYYAPRAAAFEKRLALVVAWGANHDWAEVQQRRLQREGENPVPHYWDHVQWVWGASSMDDFLAKTANVKLDGVVEKIDIPFLITHGANDRQIPVAYAQRSYEQAVNSPKRELRIFDEPEGGTEHISIDNLTYVGGFIADWIAETFAELRGKPAR
jgi:dienelactone hydrolase